PSPRELAAREAERAERAAREADEARAQGRPRFARSQPYPAPGHPQQTHGRHQGQQSHGHQQQARPPQGAPGYQQVAHPQQGRSPQPAARVPGHPAGGPVPAARPRPEGAGRPQSRERHHTPPPGRALDARRRLRRQRLVVFITVTIGVALAIAAAQGCENRHGQGLARLPAGPVGASAGAVAGGAGLGPALGLSADGAQAPLAPPPATAAVQNGGGSGQNGGTAVPTAATGATAGPSGASTSGSTSGSMSGSATGSTVSTGPSALPLLGPATGPVPSVDWADGSYGDPTGGPTIALHAGRTEAAAGSPAVTLTGVLPARYRGAAATVVVLRRTEGSVPVDLVELFGFNADSPVPLTARSSAADPLSSATWRLEEGALVREERMTQTGATATTRYTARADGSLDESWPGAGVSGGTGAGPTATGASSSAG
ncbi:hypothetical protein ACQRUO_37785, partial [Kitasatospora sp. LaBMicrA B282]